MNIDIHPKNEMIEDPESSEPSLEFKDLFTKRAIRTINEEIEELEKERFSNHSLIFYSYFKYLTTGEHIFTDLLELDYALDKHSGPGYFDRYFFNLGCMRNVLGEFPPSSNLRLENYERYVKEIDSIYVGYTNHVYWYRRTCAFGSLVLCEPTAFTNGFVRNSTEWMLVEKAAHTHYELGLYSELVQMLAYMRLINPERFKRRKFLEKYPKLHEEVQKLIDDEAEFSRVEIAIFALIVFADEVDFPDGKRLKLHFDDQTVSLKEKPKLPKFLNFA